MNQTVRFTPGQIFLTIAFLALFGFGNGRGFLLHRFPRISEIQNYSIDEKRDIYNTFDSENQNEQGFPIDPFDLMNRLKQAGAMENATTPSDALDEALNAFNEAEYENVPIK